MKETIDIPISVTYRIEDGKIIETRRKVKKIPIDVIASILYRHFKQKERHKKCCTL
jgi:hypothetical protein